MPGKARFMASWVVCIASPNVGGSEVYYSHVNATCHQNGHDRESRLVLVKVPGARNDVQVITRAINEYLLRI